MAEQSKSGERSDVVIPFGKYAGYNLSDIPESYLKWLSKTINNVLLAYDIDEEIERRGK